MQCRRTVALSLVLLTGAGVSACTSGQEPEENTPTTAAPTGEGAAPQDPDWFCRLIARDAVEAATDGRAAEALELESLSTEDEFQCDVILPTDDGGTQVAMSLSMHRDIPNLADERLAEVMALEGAAAGPDHLGVSYIADTLGVSVIPCKPDLGSTTETPEVPYVLVVRAPLDTAGAATDLLDDSLTRLAREMDQSYGCSPSKIHEKPEQGDQTEGPTGDAAVTTQPATQLSPPGR